MNELTSAIWLALVGGVVAGSLFFAYTWWRKSNTPSGRGAGLVGLLVFVAILAVLGLRASLIQVKEGTLAIIARAGKVQTVLDPGWHFKSPFDRDVAVYHVQEIVYENRPDVLISQSRDGVYVDEPVDTVTSDGQPVAALSTIRFRIAQDRVVDIFECLGDEQAVVDKLIKANARVRVRNLIRLYSSVDLQGEGLAEVEQALEEKLRQEYESEGIRLISFDLRVEFE